MSGDAARILAVTGTDTEVGKTVVTAVLAAAALQRGHRVAVYKPTQTGVGPGEEGDVQAVARWLSHPAQLTVAEGVRLAPAMAPLDALGQEARRRPSGGAGSLPSLQEHVRRVGELARTHQVVLVEGAGGLLVKLTQQQQTLADLARELHAQPVLVTRPDLGTLNHTELTLEAARQRGLREGLLVMGSWPEQPQALHEVNRANLRGLAANFGWTWAPGPPAGVVRQGAGTLTARLHAAGQKIAQTGELWEARVSAAHRVRPGR